MIPKDELDLCYDENMLLNKQILLEIGKFLADEAKSWDGLPNIGWNLANTEREIKANIDLPECFWQTTINQMFHRVNRRK